MGVTNWLSSPEDFEFLRQRIKSSVEPKKTTISVCVSTGCVALGALDVIEAFRTELNKQELDVKVDVMDTGCVGFCEQGPRVTIYPEEICYFKVKPGDVPEIVSETVRGKKIVKRLLYKEPATNKVIQKLEDIPFYKHQHRLLLENNAKLDPKSIESYIVLGGYGSLIKALFNMSPEQVLDEVKKSNLRGRGGAGFPAGRKWENTRNASGKPKYVVANCDEGDPGAFMDRTLVESSPHSVVEGLIIGAYAIGANQGFVYVRDEYPIAVKNISTAIKQAEEYGLLGENILNSGFSFGIKVHKGAGAFVSGESSALMAAIEGKVGAPRPKYVHTSERGLWDKPSCLNNVKTWANVPLIVAKGADWFTSIGTKGSSGTKIFSLVGKINNTGLVEVPMGITLRELIFDIGGGIRGDKKFKAVQTGGPSGGFISEEWLDLPVDFDELDKVGSMMGSGGMVVIDEDTCMVDGARYFVDFLLEESCGKCTPCREGLRVLSTILGDICEGKGQPKDIQTIEEIAETMHEAALCALGRTAANPVLTSLKYFRDEWEQHILDKHCTAKACKELIQYHIDPEKCKGCQICMKECPVEAVEGEKGQVHSIIQEKCVKCGTCYEMCSLEAVKKISGQPIPSVIHKPARPARKRRQTK